jgi:hypothetical protein
MTLILSGGLLSGTISVQGTPCVTSAKVIGGAERGLITFGAIKNGAGITFDGNVDGDTMSGHYRTANCGTDTGTWAATRA